MGSICYNLEGAIFVHCKTTCKTWRQRVCWICDWSKLGRWHFATTFSHVAIFSLLRYFASHLIQAHITLSQQIGSGSQQQCDACEKGSILCAWRVVSCDIVTRFYVVRGMFGHGSLCSLCSLDLTSSLLSAHLISPLTRPFYSLLMSPLNVSDSPHSNAWRVKETPKKKTLSGYRKRSVFWKTIGSIRTILTRVNICEHFWTVL